MNLPNKLSLSRILFAFIFIVVIFLPGFWPKIVALVVFSIASLTDLLDGRIARQMHLITDLGKLIDPLADKILMTAAFISFVQMGLVASWMVVIIISREFAVTGLRLVASAKGKLIAASTAGKHKTVSQFVVVFLILVLLIIQEMMVDSGVSLKVMDTYLYWFDLIILIGMLVTTAFTVISGYLYISDNMDLLKDD